jgi:hypothetical protein
LRARLRSVAGAARSSGFAGVQCRLDDAGNARRHLIREIENIFWAPSNRSAQRCAPFAASISWTVMRYTEVLPTACMQCKAARPGPQA